MDSSRERDEQLEMADGWINGWMDGRMDEWVDGLMDGWMD